MNSNNNNKRPELDDNDKSKLLEAKIAQKRNNPFAKYVLLLFLFLSAVRPIMQWFLQIHRWRQEAKDR